MSPSAKTAQKHNLMNPINYQSNIEDSKVEKFKNLVNTKYSIKENESETEHDNVDKSKILLPKHMKIS